NRGGPRTAVKPDQNESGEVSQWPFGGFDRLPFAGAAVNGLTFLGPPACAQQISNFLAGEPTRSRAAPRRQCDPNNSPVQSFLGVIIDRGAQIFEVAAGTSVIAAHDNVFAAGLPGNLRQLFASPELVQSLDAAPKPLAVGLAVSAVFVIDG